MVVLLYKVLKSIVVAYDHERTIGQDDQLPWAGQLPAERHAFLPDERNKFAYSFVTYLRRNPTIS